MKPFSHYLKALLIALICAHCMASAAIADSGVYRWVDKEGKVHFSARRPRDSEATQIQPKPISTYSAAGLSRSSEKKPDPLPQDGSSIASTNNAGKKLGNSNNNYDKQCAQARQNLTILAQFSRVKTQGPDGEQRFLTEAEMQQQKQLLAKQVAEYCQ